MFTPGEWLERFPEATPTAHIEIVEGRGGERTLKIRNVFMHSRYNPREEAARLIDSAELDFARPVLVLGTGLGYHVRELLDRGASVAVIEPDAAVARLAIEHLLRDTNVLIGIPPGEPGANPEAVAGDPAFIEFAARIPQILIHPPTAKLYPEFCDAMIHALTRAALDTQRLRIAVVGPMYGGSLPIAGYLESAFRALGHVTLLVDNSAAWPLYQQMTDTVKTKGSSKQLGDMQAHVLNEWTYARTIEFAPDIVIVMAQAPVNRNFPLRLAKEGVVTAFWYVENWRHLPYWKDIAPCYDYFFHIQPGEFEDQLSRAGCRRFAFVQTGCDPEIHKPIELSDEERAEFACDLSFAGAGYYNRVQMFKGLTDYNFKIWGVDWYAQELATLVQRPGQRFTPELFAKIVSASKINLNLHSSTVHDGVDPNCDAINPRVFEIAACGGFQVCDPAVGLDQLFDFDTELPVYRTLPELRASIDHFLAHPEERAAFAHRARQRALRDHTYTKRAQQMLDLIIEHYGPRIVRKGIKIQRTVAEMAERVGRDTPLGEYLASLPRDLLFTHENINHQLVTATNKLTYPEKVFAYLREVRNFAETLLALKP